MTRGPDLKANAAQGGKAVQLDLFGFTRPGRLRDHPLFMVWYDMQRRCNQPHRHDYRWYGGRGITVDPVWNSARAFIEWAEGQGWRPGLDVCRHDVNGPYSPDNCRVAVHREACLARRTTHRLTDGRPALPVAASNRVRGGTFRKRLEHGWTPDEAAGVQPRKRTRTEARPHSAACDVPAWPLRGGARLHHPKGGNAAPAPALALCGGANKSKGCAK